MPTVRIADFRKHVGEEVRLQGWVHNKRSGGKLQFLIVRDGSGFAQAVVSKAAVPPEAWEAAEKAGLVTRIDHHHNRQVACSIERADLRAMVYADPHRLGQVISNLLSNAIKFSPHGAEVVFNTERAGDSWCITVRDHGVGIPNEYKERIFDRFVQVDATDARKKGGTGLGLSIAKQIVIRLNGSIKVEDAPGGGSIFRVTLPALGDGLPGRLQPEANRAVG